MRFLQHHRDAVRFDYLCFDRMILHGAIRSFQHTACGLRHPYAKCEQKSHFMPNTFAHPPCNS
jgi:hypothetical protein